MKRPSGGAKRWITCCYTGRRGWGKPRWPPSSRTNWVVAFDQTSGPILQKKLDLTGILSNIRLHQVFFIDEIHRLLPDVEEMLYSALEDFRVDIMIGSGPGARTHTLDVKRFTAIGATTRQGLLSAPLRGRFGLVLRLNHYDVPELQKIVLRSAPMLSVTIDTDAAEEVARRSRGTPRIANRLLRRVRDYAQVRADGHVSLTEAKIALDLLEVDRFGLDEIDQKIMQTVLVKYGGGPVGLNTIAASIDEEASTIEEVYEPYLMQLGVHRPHSAWPGGNRPRIRLLQSTQKAARRGAGQLVLKTVYLALGTNMGDREQALQSAIDNLAQRRPANQTAFLRLRNQPAGIDLAALVPEHGVGGRDIAIPNPPVGKGDEC